MGAVLIGGLIEGFSWTFYKVLVKNNSTDSISKCCYCYRFFAAFCWSNFIWRRKRKPKLWFGRELDSRLVTLLCCILFNIFAKSHFKQLSVLFGLVVGYILAIIMGVVDFSSLEGTKIISVPQLMPFKMEFRLDAIISVVLIFLVSATETIGDTSALASSGLGRYATEKEERRLLLRVTVL